ncbi:DUF4097 family beta strand repeat-containing protein [Tenuibacillus multivorans]|nr:DUF4097 family beta strand repeat-containing protein [Tenuibacillus multivorans]GEL76526.1 hypothetical protein TMU01_07610 [Tenuibacillus multivorans]
MNDQRNKILSLLEEGHITAEEAEKLLEALEKSHEQENENTDETKDGEKREKSSFQENFKRDLKNITEGLFTMIDDTIQRVKEGPFEFSFNHVNVKRKFEFSSDEVDHLNFDLSNCSVEFLPTESSMITVQCNGKVYKEEDQERAEKLFDESFSIGVTNETLQMDQDQKNISIDAVIYLPQKVYEQAYIKTVNGSVKSRAIQLNVARISTVNGSVRLNDYDGDSLYVETKHGSIRLDEVQLSKTKLDTATGSVYLDGDVEYLDVDVTTGSVRTYLHNTDVKRVDLNTTTGSTQLYLPKDLKVKGNANTSVGSVDVDLPNVVVNKMDQMVKRMWHFYNVTDDESYLDVDVQTKTGSIKIYTLS